MATRQQAGEILGLGIPFMYAASVYGFFFYLDRKASPQAKKTISSWINSAYIAKEQSSVVAVEIFDRIYTKPLWGWRAVARSFLFTTIVSVLCIWHIYPALFWLGLVVPASLQIQWTQRIICNFA